MQPLSSLLVIFAWYVAVLFAAFFAINSDSFVFLKKQQDARGTLLVPLLGTWIVISSSAFLQENTLSVWTDIVLANPFSVVTGFLLLLLAGLFIPYTFHLRKEKNTLGATIAFGLSLGSLILFFLLVTVLLPLEIANCPCLNGFYGNECQYSCFNEGVICSGHGQCTATGCACDDRFQGTFCDSCENQFLYSTDCSTCRSFYSLTFDCTKCEVGRDPSTDCQLCLPAYKNNNASACNECKAFYFKPSALPSRESYNAFLRVGSDECTACPERSGEVCGGHGLCQHFQLELPDGGILGDDASGRCSCEDGYLGEYCDRIAGFDGENTESICNGRGTPLITYESVDLYEEFKETVCECDEGYAPSTSADDACSRKIDDLGETIGCIYGHFLSENGTCIACPGGGFLQGCNAGRGGGTCSEDGACTCFVNYDPSGTGGWSGEGCKDCAPNFYEDNLLCRPCPGAVGPLVQQACGGKGFCITQDRIQHWMNGLGTDTDSDSYAAYEFAVDLVVDLGDLNQYVGQCLCRSGFTVGLDDSCR